MAANTSRMSMNRPADDQPSLASSTHHPSRGLGSEEENLALSLMMLASGIRDEHHVFLDHVTMRPPPSPLPPHVADVPAHDLTQGAPTVEVNNQTSAPRQGPSIQASSLSSAIAARPNMVMEQVVPLSQASSPVIVTQPTPVVPLASTQARSVVSTNKVPFVNPNKASTRPIKPCKLLKTVATTVESQQQLHECPVCLKRFSKSRGLNVHMKSHPDGRMHPCVWCMSTFPNSSALRSHVRRSNTCGGNKPRKLGPVAAAAIAWHTIDLNMPEI
ncbi:hypothetical protein ZWY2020_029933 [Hordeum vulgare]|nr:hypothetical protein ZWY2020_029933 [Hordeum vulgare]